MVILVTAAIKPAHLLTAPVFPVGLFALLPDRGDEAVATAWLLRIPIVMGWAIYVLLSAAMWRARTRGAFLLIYIAFCMLLALNLGGCQRALEAASQIH
jgi:hypothetical protein